ncbi:MAG: hypothetical protein ACJAZY_003699 [Spirosomataceae bacterium]|jgi:hypothetical protein
MKPVTERLNWAFAGLGYEHPTLETQFLNQLLDSVAVGLLRNEIIDKSAYQSFILSKYNL